MSGAWFEECDASITVCDDKGIVVAMNAKSRRAYAGEGGGELIGRNVLDCHPGRSREKLASLLAEPRVNCYTIEREGRRKLIYHMPWYENGRFGGLVEIVLELPSEMPHFVRG